MLSCADSKKVSLSPDVKTLAGEFVDLLEKGEYSKAVENFDLIMKVAMSAKKLENVWTELQKKTGPYVSRESMRTATKGKYTAVFVTCQFEKTKLDIKVVFNDKKQISGLWFVPTKTAVKYEAPAYANADSFEEKDVTVGSGEWALRRGLPCAGGTWRATSGSWRTRDRRRSPRRSRAGRRA